MYFLYQNNKIYYQLNIFTYIFNIFYNKKNTFELY